MIKKNENISIIYGGSGRKYASRLKEILDEAKNSEKYNFNANIVMDSILCCDVLDKVIELVGDTRLAIIFLTKDDLTIEGEKEMYRPRQNVVLEMGMLLASIGFENCIFLADFDAKNATDYELPSDITKIMPKCFDSTNMDEVFHSVLDKVISNLRLVSHRDLLFDDSYPFNYTKLFTTRDNAAILQRNESEQKNAILELWTKEISSLTEVDQMMIFLLERLPMTNLFRYTESLHSFFTTSTRLIENGINGDQDEIYSIAFDIIKCIIGYTTTKAGFKMGKVDSSTASLRFVEYYNKIKYAVEDLENYNNINNVLAINAYDYLALLSLVLFNDNGQKQYLLDAIRCFKVCESLAKRFDDSSSLMKGYIFYNLARAYDSLVSLTDDSEKKSNQELALRYSNRAVDSRRGWVTESSFPANLSTSFSYEYFLARVFQYRMHEKYSDLYNEQMLRDELNQINNEFNIYFLSDTSSNKLLMEIKKMLDNL